MDCGTHLAVGACGEPQQVPHQFLVNAPVPTPFHCQLAQLINHKVAKL